MRCLGNAPALNPHYAQKTQCVQAPSTSYPHPVREGSAAPLPLRSPFGRPHSAPGGRVPRRASPVWPRYTIHMRRTNLVLDEKLLEQAVAALGTKTYSATVNLALEEAVRLKKIRGIPQFFGSGIWEGDLSAMREDRPLRVSRGGKGARRRTK